MRTLIIGDIHGNYKAFLQVLERAEYNVKLDRLICVGDYVDGYTDSYKVIQHLIELQKISGKNIYLLGNHDNWLKEILNNDLESFINGDTDLIRYKYSHMYNQGGRYTYESYMNQVDPKPNYVEHRKFLNDLKYYHIENNICFVHGGWDYNMYTNVEDAYNTDKDNLIWDRTLFSRAMHLEYLLIRSDPPSEEKRKFGGYDKVFIGHTQTTQEFWKVQFPDLRICNVYNLDTGAGWAGVLTGYLLETGEIFQSDLATDLYPNHIPRGR